MAEIIARFADGRLLVHEERAIEEYISGGIPFRIGLVNTVEKVLSIDAYCSGYPERRFIVPINEVKVGYGDLSGLGISGTRRDIIIPILRRGDFYGLLSGEMIASAYGPWEGTFSGIIGSSRYMEQLSSGASSGRVNIMANVIGY